MTKKLAQNALRSPLRESSRVRPKGFAFKKSITPTLMLTSLIDALTIVVLYLIVNSSDAEQMDLKDGINLPVAAYSTQVDSSPVVVFKGNDFYIEDQLIPQQQLQARLKQLKEKFASVFKNNDAAIVVQADEGIEFDKMQPLMIASAYAGIKQVKFAVLQKD